MGKTEASRKVIGIDLGTSNSCVSVMEGDRVTVIANKNGDKTHASVIAFFPDNVRLVGNEAKKQMIYNPETTVYSVKRLIGRKYFSQEVKKAQGIFPFTIMEGPNQDVRIRVREKDYSLPELSAMILKEMKSLAEEYLGEPVRYAVVTVPAYFNDSQRQCTKDAGRIAGLEVLRIINEPTAAALAYGFGRELKQKIAIYDLGGGTFDLSILELGGNVYEVIATAGDTYLGGDDFDARILEYIADQYKQRTGVDLREEKKILKRFKVVAEDVKIALSTEEKAMIKLPALEDTPQGPQPEVEIPITRTYFQQACMDLIQKTFKVCDEALQQAGLTSGDLDAVVLVGGSTKMPVVRDAVEHYFFKKPQADIDPDVVVSVGAAIQGATLLGEDKEGSLLLDVTPLSLGIETVGGYVEKLIERNTPIPVDRCKVFVTSKDNQESVKIRIYQGESRRAAENEMMGEFTLTGLRPARRGDVKVEVTFAIDTDGIVNVQARDVETGTQQSISVNVSGGLSEQEINQIIRQGGV